MRGRKKKKKEAGLTDPYWDVFAITFFAVQVSVQHYHLIALLWGENAHSTPNLSVSMLYIYTVFQNRRDLLFSENRLEGERELKGKRVE